MKKYKIYETPHKEILDTIKAGDLVIMNNDKKPMRVMAVSENYFIAIWKAFGTFIYSICEKVDYDGQWNYMDKGYPRIGPDNYYCKFEYDKVEECEKALKQLEHTLKTNDQGMNSLEIGRHGCSLRKIQIKHLEV